MRRIVTATVLALALLAGVAPARAAEEPSGQVVVLVLNNVSIAEIRTGPVPYLRSLIEESAVGLVNTLGVSRAEIDRSSVTIGGGARAQTKPETDPAMDADEPYEEGTAADAYRRRTGHSAAESSVVAVGIASLEGYNRSLPYHMIPGALGEEIVKAGGATAVFGNADTSLGYDRQSLRRESVYIAMDARGRVRYGNVGKATLRRARDAPFGVAGDTASLINGYVSVRDKAGLVVVDVGDTARAEAFRAFSEPRMAGRYRRAALRKADMAARRLVAALRPDATMIVLSPVGPEDPRGANSLTPIIIRGRGFRPGLLVSPVTQRAGLINGSDVAPTALKTLGLRVPSQFLGSPAVANSSSGSALQRLDSLQQTYDRASSEAASRGPVTAAFAIVLTVAFLGTTALLFASRPSGAVLAISRWAMLLVASAPLASYLVWLVYPASGASGGMVLTYAGLVLLIPTLTLLTAKSSIKGLVRICVATAGFIVVDQVFFEGSLAMSTFYSYSPIDGARYYGLGNEGWAILVGTLLVATAFGFDRLNLSRQALKWTIPLIFAGAVFVIGFPALGANAGGVIGATAGLAAAYLQMRDHKIGVKQVAIIVVAVGVMLTAFAVYDAARPVEVETHIGRSARLVTGSNGLAELALLVQRKILSNLKVMTRTKYSYVLLLILVVLAVLKQKPIGLFANVLRRYPSLAAATTGGLVGGFVGLFTEDSGVVIPSLIMMYVGAALVIAMIEARFETGSVSGPLDWI